MAEKFVRIAVTGSRRVNASSRSKVENVLSMLHFNDTQIILKQGGAEGVDKVVYETAYNLGWTVESFLADWNTHGKAAGPIRNRQMLDSGVDVLFAFPAPDSIGTWDCIRAAVERKIQVRIYPL
jgi:hypothetical protein